MTAPTITDQLLSIVEQARVRKDVVDGYREAMWQTFEVPPVDWLLVNTAIIKKWSRSGLIWIKREAWR